VPILLRIYWGPHHGQVRCRLDDGDISSQSVVLVTASQGDHANTGASPARFVGDAPFTVSNIAPFDGGVEFRVIIDWKDPLPLWTDVVIMDGFPRGFLTSDNAKAEPQP
jgi:hypothetical protein